ncbi:hypothetical protein [Sphaerotilus sp.]|uniref:hypothetical protein n=1 Tax=Sphaerotilus sp. TaxID=2093942 RepID=UPI0025E9A861|nr:hypothetical protein [Sphaerotilus sp.]
MSAWPALARWPVWSRSTLPSRCNCWMCPAPGDPEALPVEFLACADPLPLLEVPGYLIPWPSSWCSPAAVDPATAPTPARPPAPTTTSTTPATSAGVD